jgi:hypothetical protein
MHNISSLQRYRLFGVACLLLMGLPIFAQEPIPTPAEVKPTVVKPTAVKPTEVKPVVKTPTKTTMKSVKSTRPVYRKPVVILTLEAPDSSGRLFGILADNHFVQLHLGAETRIRRGDSLLSLSEVRGGMRLACWGRWDSARSGVFHAEGVVFQGEVDDFMLRRKINTACLQAVRTGTAFLRTILPTPSGGATDSSPQTPALNFVAPHLPTKQQPTAFNFPYPL